MSSSREAGGASADEGFSRTNTQTGRVEVLLKSCKKLTAGDASMFGTDENDTFVRIRLGAVGTTLEDKKMGKTKKKAGDGGALGGLGNMAGGLMGGVTGGIGMSKRDPSSVEDVKDANTWTSRVKMDEQNPTWGSPELDMCVLEHSAWPAELSIAAYDFDAGDDDDLIGQGTLVLPLGAVGVSQTVTVPMTPHGTCTLAWTWVESTEFLKKELDLLQRKMAARDMMFKTFDEELASTIKAEELFPNGVESSATEAQKLRMVTEALRVARRQQQNTRNQIGLLDAQSNEELSELHELQKENATLLSDRKEEEERSAALTKLLDDMRVSDTRKDEELATLKRLAEERQEAHERVAAQEHATLVAVQDDVLQKAEELKSLKELRDTQLSSIRELEKMNAALKAGEHDDVEAIKTMQQILSTRTSELKSLQARAEKRRASRVMVDEKYKALLAAKAEVAEREAASVKLLEEMRTTMQKQEVTLAVAETKAEGMKMRAKQRDEELQKTSNLLAEMRAAAASKEDELRSMQAREEKRQASRRHVDSQYAALLAKNERMVAASQAREAELKDMRAAAAGKEEELEKLRISQEKRRTSRARVDTEYAALQAKVESNLAAIQARDHKLNETKKLAESKEASRRRLLDLNATLMSRTDDNNKRLDEIRLAEAQKEAELRESRLREEQRRASRARVDIEFATLKAKEEATLAAIQARDNELQASHFQAEQCRASRIRIDAEYAALKAKDEAHAAAVQTREDELKSLRMLVDTREASRRRLLDLNASLKSKTDEQIHHASKLADEMRVAAARKDDEIRAAVSEKDQELSAMKELLTQRRASRVRVDKEHAEHSAVLDELRAAVVRQEAELTALREEALQGKSVQRRLEENNAALLQQVQAAKREATRTRVHDRRAVNFGPPRKVGPQPTRSQSIAQAARVVQQTQRHRQRQRLRASWAPTRTGSDELLKEDKAARRKRRRRRRRRLQQKSLALSAIARTTAMSVAELENRRRPAAGSAHTAQVPTPIFSYRKESAFRRLRNAVVRANEASVAAHNSLRDAGTARQSKSQARQSLASALAALHRAARAEDLVAKLGREAMAVAAAAPEDILEARRLVEAAQVKAVRLCAEAEQFQFAVETVRRDAAMLKKEAREACRVDGAPSAERRRTNWGTAGDTAKNELALVLPRQTGREDGQRPFVGGVRAVGRGSEGRQPRLLLGDGLLRNPLHLMDLRGMRNSRAPAVEQSIDPDLDRDLTLVRQLLAVERQRLVTLTSPLRKTQRSLVLQRIAALNTMLEELLAEQTSAVPIIVPTRNADPKPTPGRTCRDRIEHALAEAATEKHLAAASHLNETMSLLSRQHVKWEPIRRAHAQYFQGPAEDAPIRRVSVPPKQQAGLMRGQSSALMRGAEAAAAQATERAWHIKHAEHVVDVVAGRCMDALEEQGADLRRPVPHSNSAAVAVLAANLATRQRALDLLKALADVEQTAHAARMEEFESDGKHGGTKSVAIPAAEQLRAAEHRRHEARCTHLAKEMRQAVAAALTGEAVRATLQALRNEHQLHRAKLIQLLQADAQADAASSGSAQARLLSLEHTRASADEALRHERKKIALCDALGHATEQIGWHPDVARVREQFLKEHVSSQRTLAVFAHEGGFAVTHRILAMPETKLRHLKVAVEAALHAFRMALLEKEAELLSKLM